MEESLLFWNIQLIEDGVVTPDAALMIEQGKICYAGPMAAAPYPDGIRIIDGQDRWVAPGYIDLQLNGGFGQDFAANPGALLEVAQQLPQTGGMAFLPTFISSPLESYPAMLQAVASALALQVHNPPAGARLLGAHVEGPFLNPTKKGAHNQEFFRRPDLTALSTFQPLSAVRLMT